MIETGRWLASDICVLDVRDSEVGLSLAPDGVGHVHNAYEGEYECIYTYANNLTDPWTGFLLGRTELTTVLSSSRIRKVSSLSTGHPRPSSIDLLPLAVRTDFARSIT